MSNTLIQTKSMLAKLLAGENINVVHQSGISTASFDLTARTMYLPIWEDMDGDIYDMLTGHEVGHAKWTPQEGWHNAIDERGRKFKSCMNVIEDARIEKLIKRKYPGLAKSFANAYRTLYERDFFGIKKLKDLSKLNLIDRINIHCKVGAHVIVPFTDDERNIVREVEKAETWEQVMDISVRVFDYAKKEDSSKINSLDDLTEKLLKEYAEKLNEEFEDSDEESDGGDFDFDDEESEDLSIDGNAQSESDDSEKTEDEEGNTETKSKGGNASDDSEEDKEEEDEDNAESGKAGGNNGPAADLPDEEKAEEEEPESITDRIFRDREQELCVGNVEVYTYTLPEPILENIVVPGEAVVKQFHIAYDASNRRGLPIAQNCIKTFEQNNGKFINMLVKEFEMRKNASQYARQQTARTGELDMSKLHLYRFSNDLFKKVTVVPKGKSHGLIMYVDMSGSMSNVFGATMEQALILAVFCRKVGIPFDVYGFSDGAENIHVMVADGTLPNNFGLGGKFKKFGQADYTIHDKGFHLRHLIGSKMNKQTYRKAMEMLAVVSYNYSYNRYATNYLDWERAGFNLHGTPFSQTLLASRPMIERFKSQNHLDIVNVIYLTDGEGGGCFSFDKIERIPYYMQPVSKKDRKIRKVWMTDSKTKRRLEFNPDEWDQQSRITQFVGEVTGCKHIAYYICSSRECKQALNAYGTNAAGSVVLEAEKSYKNYKYFAVPHLGYHKYFYIAMPSQNVSDDDYELDDKMTAKRMARIFSNAQDAKRKNRMLITEFTQEIAA